MTIKLYGTAMSAPVARVLLTLYEKDEVFEFVEVKMQAGDHKKPEYMAMHPFGQVPVMVDGPLTMFESRAMMRYVAKKCEGRGTALCGSTPEDQALVDQWTEVESHTFGDPCMSVMREVMKPMYMGQPTDEVALASHKDKLGKVLDVYDAHLAKSKYLVGGFFSLADLTIVPMLSALVKILKYTDLLEGRPHLKAWWEDISGRPTWQKVYEMMLPAVAQFQAGMKAK